MTMDNTEIVQYVEPSVPAMQARDLQAGSTESTFDAAMRLAELAMRNPRDEARILQKVLAAAPPTINGKNDWWYKVPNRGEGLSVVAARSIVRHYHNCTVIPKCVEAMLAHPDGGLRPGWNFTVLVVDMENCFITSSTGSCFKPERKMMTDKRTGEQYPEPPLAFEERCLAQQQAFQARIERNAIFKVVPGEWRAQIKAAIDAKDRLKPLAERVKSLVESCAEIGITDRDLRRVLGCAPAMMNEAQWADMRDRLSAVKNGECVATEAFGEKGPLRPEDQHADTQWLESQLKANGISLAEARKVAEVEFGSKRLENLTVEQAQKLIEIVAAQGGGKGMKDNGPPANAGSESGHPKRGDADADELFNTAKP